MLSYWKLAVIYYRNYNSNTGEKCACACTHTHKTHIQTNTHTCNSRWEEKVWTRNSIEGKMAKIYWNWKERHIFWNIEAKGSTKNEAILYVTTIQGIWWLHMCEARLPETKQKTDVMRLKMLKINVGSHIKCKHKNWSQSHRGKGTQQALQTLTWDSWKVLPMKESKMELNHS